MKTRVVSSWSLTWLSACLLFALASASAGGQEAEPPPSSSPLSAEITSAMLPNSPPSWDSFGAILTSLEDEVKLLREESTSLSSALQKSQTEANELRLSLARSERSLTDYALSTEEALQRERRALKTWRTLSLILGGTSLVLGGASLIGR